jgi:hypothetical protein
MNRFRKINELRKWVVDHVLAPLACWVMPFDGWAYASLTTEYFWVVLVSKFSDPDRPCPYRVVAIQCSCDAVVQTWDMDQMDRDAVTIFVDKLRKTQGVNNVCYLDKGIDIDHLGEALDKIKPQRRHP